MTALTSPKGPLPPRVYWTRRLLLLGVVFLLVFGIARVLGGGSDAKSETPKAEQAAAELQDSAPAPSQTESTNETPSEPAGKKNGKNAKPVEKTPEAPVLPTATGVCTNEDVVVTPTVAGAQGGGQVQFVLNFRTKVTPACTWQVSADTVTLKITSGDDDIWASRECPKSIPTQDVTLYRDYDTSIPATWSGRRSDEDCSKADWVDAGWYHVLAATYAGEPVDVQFELGVPSPVTVTKTVQPMPDAKAKKGGASGEPSGAVEPNGE
ncbi:hypothetical protein [Nocardioides sp. InS609-2]|uniref:hypothetical protein n=1 Tax=Nocardioides sp. InS609-2 TaxID=2760705 RepID=UPI0020BFD741|nr:hypothetical protein [Nocardioides sp. InS609-2]